MNVILHIFTGYIILEINGLNIERFINDCLKNNIFFNSINRKNKNTLICNVDIVFQKRLEDILYKYNIKFIIKKERNIIHFNRLMLSRLSIIIAIIINFTFILIFSNFLWRIDINGCERVQKDAIIKLVQDCGYHLGTNIKDIDCNKLENYILSNNDDLSMISIIKCGSSLFINLKEKIYDSEADSKIIKPIYAKKSGVITKIELVQGTSLVKVGQVIKVGDKLIDDKIIDTNGIVRPMNAIGKVYADTFIVGSVDFIKSSQKFERTGNIQSIKIMSLGNSYLGNIKKPNFEYYEVENNKISIFQNLLIPLKLNKINYYEIKKLDVIRDFNKEKDLLIKESKYKAYEQIKSNFNIVSEKTEIFDLGKGDYTIQTLLCVEQDIAN
jgi:similar to stage IV sporulation protein